MDACEDVSVGVDLEEVAVVHVEPESPRGERWVVLELEELLGVTERDEAVLQQPKAQNLTVEEEKSLIKSQRMRQVQYSSYLVLWRFVLRQGVVHVETEELDLLEMETPVDKDPANFKTVMFGRQFEIAVAKCGGRGVFFPPSPRTRTDLCSA